MTSAEDALKDAMDFYFERLERHKHCDRAWHEYIKVARSILEDRRGDPRYQYYDTRLKAYEKTDANERP